MRHPVLTALALAAALGAAPLAADAQIHQRWKLDYSMEKPQIHTHRAATGELENFWWFAYTLENNTTQVVPLLVDIMLYTETGKDLQTDLRKVDPDPQKVTAEHPTKHEPLKFGRYVSNVLIPELVEHEIITYHAKIGNRSPGIVRESIEELKKGNEKGDRWYLNPRDLREQRFIKPGQKIHALAIFKNVDPRARLVEVHVSGLWDVLRIEQFIGETEELEDVKIHYENRVYKVRYDFRGDEFGREKDVIVQKGIGEWTVKNIGPVASKETVGNLVDTLLKVLNRWEQCVKENMAPDQITADIAKFNLTPQDFAISARVIHAALGKDFGYDASKTLMENQAAVWRIHEWWVTNRHKLAFNETTGRFEVREEIPPGTVRD